MPVLPYVLTLVMDNGGIARQELEALSLSQSVRGMRDNLSGRWMAKECLGLD